jgi:trk system potassium uptake protein
MHIIIVGAGKVGYYLSRRLCEDKHVVSVIEADKATCEEIARELKVLVIRGDGCEPQLLEQAGAAKADVVAAVTGDDEDNLIICQLAKELFHVQRTVGRVNDPQNEKTFAELGVDIPMNSTEVIARIIEEEVSFSDFATMMSFKRGRLAIVRMDLPNDSPVIDKQVRDIHWPENSVLLSVLRKDEVIIPRGDTVLMAGDDVIALTMVGTESQLSTLLAGKE